MMSVLLNDYSDQKKFRFTILAPLHNRLEYFEEWLESILEQTHLSSTEVLFLDDSSEAIHRQDLEAILQKYRQHIELSPYTFYYFRHSQNLGQYANINVGLQLANGEWIQIIHDDDRLLSEAFLQFEQIIDNNPNLDLISCRFYKINDQDDILEKSPQLAPTGLGDRQFLQQFLSENPLHPVALLYHKNIFTKIGYFNPALKTAAAWEWLRRAAKIQDVQWYYLSHHLVCYRLHSKLSSFFDAMNPAGEFIWQMVALGQQYYSESEQICSRKSQYLRLFTMTNQFLESKQIAKVCSMMLDIVKFSNLGDRLWLEVLNQSNLSHKKELYNFVVQFSQKPYLS